MSDPVFAIVSVRTCAGGATGRGRGANSSDTRRGRVGLGAIARGSAAAGVSGVARAKRAASRRAAFRASSRSE